MCGLIPVGHMPSERVVGQDIARTHWTGHWTVMVSDLDGGQSLSLRLMGVRHEVGGLTLPPSMGLGEIVQAAGG